MRIDLYWSFFSGYCYLAGVRLERAQASRPFDIALRPVWPLAFRVPKAIFEAPPAYTSYYDLDTARVARHLGVRYADPVPPPATLDWEKKSPAADQPHIRRLTRLGVEAERRGRGFAYARAISELLFAGGPGWNQGNRMADALAARGLDLADMERALAREEAAIDNAIAANGETLAAIGHWGTPTMVLDGEPFFGQDRVDLLLWRMTEKSRG
jgi:2-hydroxychromene-2-carboxylate isomerase